MNQITLTRRAFLNRSLLLGGTAIVSARCSNLARAADGGPEAGPATNPADTELDFQAAIRPAPKSALFTLDDYYVWGAAPARTDDGNYHLFYSRWPRRLGHYAWVTHSEVAHATSESPLGPFEPREVSLTGSGGENWDAHCIHNPTLICTGGKFYLYYMGNRGTGKYAAGPSADEQEKVQIDERWWDHRNNQRIGVAVADHPAGPWKRSDKPVIDVNPAPGSWDHLIAANPAVTEGPGGRFLMMYKTVADRPMPGGGKVQHGMASADNPLGPFTKHPDPVLTHPTINFPAEDPFLWYQAGRYRLIVKDHNAFLQRGTCLAHMESADGLIWKPARQPMVAKPPIAWDDGTSEPVKRMERPQLLIEDGVPTVLRVACDWDDKREKSCNIGIPLRWEV